MKISLYEITQEFDALDELLALEEGEYTNEIESLESQIGSLLSSKTDACVEYRQSRKDLVELAKNRKKQLDEFIKIETSKIERFENNIMFCMEKMDVKKIEGQLHKITIRKPSKKVIITDEDKIPSEYVDVEVVRKIKKTEISKALKADEKIEGAELVEGKKSLLIK